jgi:hypothetical protein
MPSQTPAKSDAQVGGATLYGVGIWNLHVLVTNDDGSWFAQAAEIDYAAEGDSLNDVKQRFEEGLCATIHQHLKVYGHLDHMIQPAPREVWQELLKATAPTMQQEYSQVSFHLLRFTQVEYTILPKAA